LDFPKIEFRSRQQLRDWLDANHATASSFWLVSFKKHVTDRYVPYGDIVEELLCYGWIDSIVKTIDEERYRQKFTPRKDKSNWSATNKERVKKLKRQGKMTPAGMAKVNAIAGRRR